MIRAFLLRLLGFSPVWEVRQISQKSGKDIPGERKYKGDYRGAKAFYKDHTTPPGHELRLQALLVTKSRYFPTIDDSPLTAEDIEDIHQRHDSPPVLADVPHGTPEHDIEASNRRQDEFMRKHQDEPNVDGPGPGDEDYAIPGNEDLEEQDHECDGLGPLEWDETGGAYVPTCSTCGRLN